MVAASKLPQNPLAADPPRTLIYTLDANDGELDVWDLPLPNHGKHKFGVRCLGGTTACNGKSEHLFLAQ